MKTLIDPSIAHFTKKVNSSLSLSLSHKLTSTLFPLFFFSWLRSGKERGSVELPLFLGLQNRSEEQWEKSGRGVIGSERDNRTQEKVQIRTSGLHSFRTSPNSSSAFTIVELLIVIVIIAILAAITIISYNGISNRTKLSSLKTELSQSAKKLESQKVLSGTETYPSTLSSAGIQTPSSITYKYTPSGSTYCLQGTYESYIYHISTTDTSPTEGECPDTTTAIQTVTKATCPSTRTMVKDARDNHTYWIQKLADGQCWMLTNLAYAGGGTNTYSDTIPTGDGTNGTLSGPDNSGSTTYTSAKYYIPIGANPTTSPTEPSTSTDGGTTGTQYGYLYNWCAAMGAQNNTSGVNTSACANATTPTPDTTVSICPAGWRLPTGGSSGEFTALNTAINSGSTSTDQGLRENWFAQRSGYWYDGFNNQGSFGYYWSSSQYSATNAYYLSFGSSYVYPAIYNNKNSGQAVRRVAR